MAKDKPLQIFFVSAEYAPYAKAGGLADVSAALSAYLAHAGHDVRVLIPLHRSVQKSDLTIEPVADLQNLTIEFGPHQFTYSIDTAAIPDTPLSIYLLRCPELFDRDTLYSQSTDEHLRFITLSRVALEICQRMALAPDIMHVHDWHTALIPLLLKTAYAWDKLFAKTRTVLTIHNIAYQGIIDAENLIDLGIGPGSSKLDPADLYAGHINFLKTGAIHADLLTTVSPTYAREIQSTDLGMGLQSVLSKRRNALTGILNGVDYATWDPVADPLIPHKYSPGRLAGKRKNKIRLIDDLGLNVAPDTPLIGVVSRLAEQKGIDLMIKTLPKILKTRSAALVVLGNGQPEYEKFFRNLQDRFSDRCCFYDGYNEQLAHLIEAGSDMFLMPSRFEPCGLNQMYSLRYGTVPIVRQTGGLADTVEHYDATTGSGTGVVFKDYDTEGLTWALNTALDLYADKKAWKTLIKNGMEQDFSWGRQGALYVDLYRQLTQQPALT